MVHHIEAINKSDLPDILSLQKIAFEKVAVLMDNYDIPPLKQTLEEIRDEYCKGVILKYISE